MTDFWKTTSLADMSTEQWESLCDGCALCCLQKLENEEDGEIYYTNIACRLLETENNANSCRCKHYQARSTLVDNCMVLTPENLMESLGWLPDTCAYKLLAQKQPLPIWHPLISGDSNTVHTANISTRGRCVSESEVDEDDIEEHIVFWVSGFGE